MVLNMLLALLGRRDGGDGGRLLLVPAPRRRMRVEDPDETTRERPPGFDADAAAAGIDPAEAWENVTAGQCPHTGRPCVIMALYNATGGWTGGTGPTRH